MKKNIENVVKRKYINLNLEITDMSITMNKGISNKTINNEKK